MRTWLKNHLRRVGWLGDVYHGVIGVVNFCGTFIQWGIVNFNYSFVLRRLRKDYGKRKLRVLFLIADDTKWKCQLIYDAMEKSGRYEPCIAVTAMNLGFFARESQPGRVSKCAEFFRQKGLRMVVAVNFSADSIKATPLREYRPDIVIYQQPAGMAACQAPFAVSRYALTFYLPYYMPAYPFPHTQVSSRFHRTLFGNFLEGQDWIDCFRQTVPLLWMGARMYACGCPLREEIAVALRQEKKEELVIYAPHWSCPGISSPGHCYSTFLKTGRPILKFAKMHPEIRWVFKPHPVLKDKLIQSGLWSEREVEGYFKEWEQIGEVCDSGDYVRLFARSRTMITDCLSFLSEYLVTNRPLIRLEPVDQCWEMKPPARRKLDGMYRVSNLSELDVVFESVIARGEDDMAEMRDAVVRELGYDKSDLSHQLMDQFDKILRVK